MKTILSTFFKSLLVIVLLASFVQDYSFAFAEGQTDKQLPRHKSEVLVKYKDASKSREANDRVGKKLSANKLSSKQKMSRTGVELLSVEGTGTLDQVLAELRKDPNVQYAQLNYELTPLAVPGDERFQESWGLNNTGQSVAMQTGVKGMDIRVLEAWQHTIGQASTVIGVLDTGIDIRHPDLASRIYLNTLEIPDNGLDDDGNGYIDDVNGWDFANGDATVYDAATQDKHGTFVAGLIAASANDIGSRGVAPGVTLMPLKFISDNKGYTSDAIAAIEYAKQAGVKIINASFGSPSSNPALEEAIRISGILFISGAGNNGQDAGSHPVYPAAFALPNVISVAAIDNQGALGASSNHGSSVDLAAPGVATLSTLPNESYGLLTGTSMAAAYVSGIAGLVQSAYPDLTAEQLADRIRGASRPIASLQGKVASGGIVDAVKAITGVAAQTVHPDLPAPVIGEEDLDDMLVTLAAEIDPALQEQIHYGEEGVSVTTGNYSKTVTDMSVVTPGFTLNIGRTYNSKDDRPSSWMGRGWTFSFEGSLKLTGNQMVAKLPNGSAQVFIKSGETYIANDSHSVLKKQADNSHILTTSDQYSYGFTSDGYLSWMKDAYGNTIAIEVSNTGKVTKITDTVGRAYTVSYTGNFIQKVTDVTGRFITYGYDSSNRLTTVTDAENQVVARYEYDSYGYLNVVKNAKGHVVEAMVYNRASGANQHKVSRYTDTYGNVQTFAYDTTNRKTTVTDVNGRILMKWYDTAMYVTKSQDPEGKQTIVEYYTDASGFNKYGEEKSITDRNGNKTLYERDARGNITKIVNPDGSFREYAYDQTNQLVMEKDELGKATYYEYSNHMRTKQIKPMNGTDEYKGTLSGSFIVTSYAYYSLSEAQRFGLSVQGLLKSETDPEGNTTTYTYDKYGNVSTSTAPSGGITRKNYSPLGWLTSIVTPEGYRTDYTYDKNGRLLRQVEDGGETTRYVYDADGLNAQVIHPNQYQSFEDQLVAATGMQYNNTEAGIRSSYYPNGKLERTVDTMGYETRYEYDIYGNVTREVRPNDSEYIYEYDVMNRIKGVSFKTSRVAVPVKVKETAYQTLTNGHERQTATVYLNDTEQAVTVTTTDDKGRVLEQQLPDGGVKRWAYHPNGLTSALTDARGNTTYYVYDGLNRLSNQWAPLENGKYMYTGFSYNRNGQKTEERKGKDPVALYSQSVGDRMVVTSYTYDQDGRNTELDQSSDSKIKMNYNSDGQMTQKEVYTSASTSMVTKYSYNHRGQIVSQKIPVRAGDISGVAFSDNNQIHLETKNRYDANGNLSAIITPDGKETRYVYDARNRVIKSISESLDEQGKPAIATTSSTYNWEDKPLTTTDALGRTTNYAYNAFGSLELTTYPDDSKQLEVYDRAQRRIAVISPEAYRDNQSWNQMGRTVYTYDNMDRVQLVMEVFESKTYNPQTQTWTTKWSDLVTKAYAYDENGNVIKELSGEGYAFGTGKTIDERIQNGYGTRTTYNAANLRATIIDPVSAEKGNRTTNVYKYDGLGRVINEIDAIGTVYVTYYDDGSRVSSTAVRKSLTSPEQVLTRSTYDWAGQLLEQIDANGHRTKYVYNAMGQIRTIESPGDETIPAQMTTRQYDVMGRPAKEWDAGGTTKITVYDPNGRVISQSEQSSQGKEKVTTSFGYDLVGNKRFEVNGNGYRTDFIYDAMNRVFEKTIQVSKDPVRNQSTTYEYDRNGNLRNETNWLGQVTSYVYDGINRLVETRDADGIAVERLTYNANHAQVKAWDALNRLTQFQYDRNNRETVRVDALNYRTENVYNELGLVSSHRDARGNETTYAYDFMRRLQSVTNALDEVTSYTYDLAGNKLTQTDGRGHTQHFEYNAANLLQSRIDPAAVSDSVLPAVENRSAKTESYSYNADGSLAIKQDRNGHMTNYTYDIHGQLTKETVDGAGLTHLTEQQRRISYTYDANGNQLTMTDSTGTTSRTYDGLNRVVAKSVPKIGTSVFEYDVTQGMPSGYSSEKTIDAKGHETVKVYDRVNRLSSVKSSPTDTATYTYYNDGSLKTLQYSNGVKEEYTYTANNQLHTLKNYKGSTLLDSYTYTYDAAGNQLSKTEMQNGTTIGTTTYAYDELNRLSRVQEPSGRVTTYTYDASGNRTQEKVVQGSQVTLTMYTYNEQNRLMDTTEVKTSGEKQIDQYKYDNNGNLIFKGREVTKVFDPMQPIEPSFGMFITGQENENPSIHTIVDGTAQYVYDGWNQLIQIGSGSGSSTYVYNGEGLRTQKTVGSETTLYLYEYDKVVLEVDGKGQSKARNVYGINLLTRVMGSEKYSYLYNGHGDVTSLVDSAGVVQASYRYDAFGNHLESMGTVENPIRYAGYQYDEESELYYLNARYYDPKIARFLSEDTYRGNARDPLSLNLYTYTINNPLKYYDPSGHNYVDRGDKGTAVKEVQKMLVDAGYKIAVDGSFGPATEAAVKQFQTSNGLKVDGSVGAQTMKALQVVSSTANAPMHIQQLALESARNTKPGALSTTTTSSSSSSSNKQTGTSDKAKTTKSTTGNPVSSTTTNNSPQASKPTGNVSTKSNLLSDLAAQFNKYSKETLEAWGKVVENEWGSIKEAHSTTESILSTYTGGFTDSFYASYRNPMDSPEYWYAQAEVLLNSLSFALPGVGGKTGLTTTTARSTTVTAGANVVKGAGKVPGMPPIVQSRINISNDGWKHVVDRHFSGKNASQFTVTQDELRSLLSSEEIVNSPVVRSIDSADGVRYVREITLDKSIGLDKFNDFKPTSTFTILTDKHGNLVTATPGVIK
ncbi:RHS repeat-associated core domain-containing protein [Paenibacillus agaridevorans]|uniref:RHS repeat-associated core domain-containing protein n=1 Tax=Paenibacillus agaridevorans TaxID=171404 RepID=A0A2R5EMS6_9BACL|nr:S8 family serine peptidase [Paenibacillus agaridevorans]GBG07986.1 RHS repeat-associated core domain-containing protein [Paenibacillus agaridevorans]